MKQKRSNLNTEQKSKPSPSGDGQSKLCLFRSVSPPKKSFGFLGPKNSSERIFRKPVQTHMSGIFYIPEHYQEMEFLEAFMCGYKTEGFGDKGGRSRIIILVLALISIIGLIVIVSALTTEEQVALQSKLNNLTGYLTNNNYGWLVNYPEETFIKLNLSIKGDLSL